MKSRTPKNYQGTENPAKKMADLLPGVLAKLSRNSPYSKEDIALFWQTLLGEQMAGKTEVVSWSNGILTVKVKSSTLYSLLMTHERARLLARLKEKFSIRDLLFRVG